MWMSEIGQVGIGQEEMQVVTQDELEIPAPAAKNGCCSVEEGIAVFMLKRSRKINHKEYQALYMSSSKLL